MGTEGHGQGSVLWKVGETRMEPTVRRAGCCYGWGDYPQWITCWGHCRTITATNLPESTGNSGVSAPRWKHWSSDLGRDRAA